MTDKDKLQANKEELEQMLSSIRSSMFRTAELGSEKFSEGEECAYKNILQFIYSLSDNNELKKRLS